MTKIDAYSEALKEFQQKDPLVIAINSGADYDSANQTFTLRYCNTDYNITYPGGIISCKDAPSLEVGSNDKSLIMLYLAKASGLPPRGKWLSFLELEGGPAHYVPFLNEAVNPLAKSFGSNPDLFMEIGKKLGGEKIEIGNYGFQVPVFPKLVIAVILYIGDEEFPAKANIIYDSIVEASLPMAPLWVLGVEFSKKMRRLANIEVIEQNF